MKKTSAAGISIASNITLVLAKLFVGLLTNSISIISEAIHSTLDLVAAVMAYFAVRGSQKPPDEGHPFGHGKFENISGLFEGLLIFVAAGIIFYESIEKIITKSPVENLPAGLAVMAFSAVVNIFVSRILTRVAKESGSVALEADAAHLTTDVYSRGIRRARRCLYNRQYRLRPNNRLHSGDIHNAFGIHYISKVDRRADGCEHLKRRRGENKDNN